MPVGTPVEAGVIRRGAPVVAVVIVVVLHIPECAHSVHRQAPLCAYAQPHLSSAAPHCARASWHLD